MLSGGAPDLINLINIQQKFGSDFCWNIVGAVDKEFGSNEMKINRPVSAGRFGLTGLSLTVRRRGDKKCVLEGPIHRACLPLSYLLPSYLLLSAMQW